MSIQWFDKEELIKTVPKYIKKTSVVLEVGPGIYPQSYFQPALHICIEAHRPYIESFRNRTGIVENMVFLNSEWRNAMEMFLPNSVDTVIAIDFIEHLSKEDGVQFLKLAEKIARQQIVIFTPLGFYEQSYDPKDETDRWGMNGGYWQAHRSGWKTDDFNEKWELLCCSEYHYMDENEQPLEKPIGVIWGFLGLARKQTTVSLESTFFQACIKNILRKIKKRGHRLI